MTIEEMARAVREAAELIAKMNTRIAELKAENAELRRLCDPGSNVVEDPDSVYRDPGAPGKANAVMVEQAARDAAGLADQMEAWPDRKVPD